MSFILILEADWIRNMSLCLKKYPGFILDEASVAPVKLLNVKTCSYDGWLPGVKLWNFMSEKLGLAREEAWVFSEPWLDK